MLEKKDISSIEKKLVYEYIEILDGSEDKKELEDVTIKNSILKNLGMNEAKFRNSRFTQTTFENCYFRNAEFHGVDLTGSKFINCNLEKTKFRICTFRYVEFSNCKLNLDEILGNLPAEPNLKIGFLKQLYINMNSSADRKVCDKLSLLILDEEKQDLKNKFKAKNSYYKNLQTLDRLESLLKYILNSINDFVWGYGIKIGRLIRFAILTIILFGLIIFISDAKYFNTIDNNELLKLNMYESIFSSYVNFMSVGMGYYIPANITAKVLFGIENAFGLIFVGCLVAALYRRISK